MAGDGEPLKGREPRPPDEQGGLRGAVASTIELPRGPDELPRAPEAPPPAPGDLPRAPDAPPPDWDRPLRRHRRGRSILLVALLIAAAAILVPVVFVAVLAGPFAEHGAALAGCGAGATDATLPANLGAPGQLGGIAGTGITQADFDAVRRSRYASSRITPGQYVATSYGPPWGGIEGNGNQTAGGLHIGGGAPQKYFVAVDPELIGHGTWVYLWPNPFGWSGPFLAADTGGAIKQRRIDFYDWRGRAAQNGWGRRVVQVSATPLVTGAGGSPAAPTGAPGAGDPAVATASDCGAGNLIDAGGGWGGVTGPVEVAPGANAPGRPMQAPILAFIAGVAGHAGRKIVISTGTNHSQYTTSGNVSDHWYGLAADLGSVANHFEIGGAGGTLIAAAALVTAGVPAAAAQQIAAVGGVHNVCSRAPDGTVWRVQVLWKTYTGGNHYNHVHVGLRQGCTYKGVQTSA